MLELGDRIWLTKRDGVDVTGWREWTQGIFKVDEFGFLGPCGGFMSITVLARMISRENHHSCLYSFANTLCVVEQLLGSGEVRV